MKVIFILAFHFTFLVSCNPVISKLTKHSWVIDTISFPESSYQNYNEISRKTIEKQLKERSEITFKRDSVLHLVLPTQNLFLKWWLSKDKKNIVVKDQEGNISETPVSYLSKNEFKFISKDFSGNEIQFLLIPKVDK